LWGGGLVGAMLSVVVLNVYRHIRQHRNNVTNQRREYLGYISEVRSEVREAAKNQRHTAVSHLPEPEALPYLVQHGARVWERRQGQDHLLIRLGRSSQPLAATIEAEEVGPLNTPDPVCLSAMHRFITTHTEVDALPFGIELSAFSHIEVVGPLNEARAQAAADQHAATQKQALAQLDVADATLTQANTAEMLRIKTEALTQQTAQLYGVTPAAAPQMALPQAVSKAMLRSIFRSLPTKSPIRMVAVTTMASMIIAGRPTTVMSWKVSLKP